MIYFTFGDASGRPLADAPTASRYEGLLAKAYEADYLPPNNSKVIKVLTSDYGRAEIAMDYQSRIAATDPDYRKRIFK